MSIAGLALIGTIANSLQSAVSSPSDRETAVITFLVTVSGIFVSSVKVDL